MNTMAVVLKEPERLALRRVDLSHPGDDDVVVDMEWSGISTGTEKLLSLGAGLRIGWPGDFSRPAFLVPRWRQGVRAGRALLRRCAWPFRRRRSTGGGAWG